MRAVLLKHGLSAWLSLRINIYVILFIEGVCFFVFVLFYTRGIKTEEFLVGLTYIFELNETVKWLLEIIIQF